MMKIIFFGSDDFAQAHLEEILAQQFDVVATVTQPDRPKGRGMAMHVSPIKEVAQQHGIDCLQPTDLKEDDFIQALRAYDADLFVVIAYGRFLPQTLLDLPNKGAINVHGSLLPKYRGAAPINWAIINGEKETGVTVMFLNRRMDAGDIIAQTIVPIDAQETAVTLRQKMIRCGKETLTCVIKQFEDGDVLTQPQKESQVTFAPKLTKDLGQIDWTKPAIAIDRFVRGLQPWPGAYTFLDKKILKILDVEPIEGKGNPGELVAMGDESMDIATGNGLLRVHHVHLQDAKAMSAANFLRGQRIQVGFSF